MVVTDFSGNVVEFNGTRQDALDKGLNVDCVNCSGCSGCSDCSDCSRCSRCSDCSRCSEQPLASIVTGSWTICIRVDGTMKIGCQDHTTEEWLAFTDEQIGGMHCSAVKFWKKWKPVVISILEGAKNEHQLSHTDFSSSS